MIGRKDFVEDEEELYRRIRATVGNQVCYQIEDGRVVFFHSAFNDVSKQPSVDRAKLRKFDPHRSRLTKEDAIVALQTGAIRRLGPIPQYDSRGRQQSEYAVDVSHAPIFGNCAHALDNRASCKTPA